MIRRKRIAGDKYFAAHQIAKYLSSTILFKKRKIDSKIMRTRLMGEQKHASIIRSAYD
jgi:hypothetical protein